MTNTNIPAQPTLWQRFRLWWGFQKMANRYRDMGSPCPELEAMKELQWRAQLEGLRDFATDEWLATGRDLDEIKQDWMDLIIKPMAEFTDYKELIAIRRVVKEMLPDELLHPHAYKAWSDEIDANCKRILEEHHRENPTGYTPHEIRVLLNE